MPTVAASSLDQPFAKLRSLARPRLPVERCELCSAPMATEHGHLLELASRQIVCACDACSILFDGINGGRYKRVPREVRLLADLQISDGQWEDLLIPINMAFFFYSSAQARMVALYPSPAGAVESLLPLEAWSEIAKQRFALGNMESDVEALLVNRVGHARGSAAAEYYIAPMDQCFALVGLIRTHWKGLSGGDEVWMEIAKFFNALRTRADVIGGENRA
jgi:hypothetical protein